MSTQPYTIEQLRSMSEDEYRKFDAANYSTLKHAARSAAHMYHALTSKIEQTPAMKLGSLVDRMTFDPVWQEHYAVAPDVDRRTTAGKEKWQEFQASVGNRTIVTLDDIYQATAMVLSIDKHPIASQLRKCDYLQHPMIWVDPVTNVVCKGLPDAIKAGNALIDLKTTQVADMREFARTCANFGYYMQAAFYIDGWKALTGEELPFIFIVVESSAPHCVATYRLDDAAIEAGRSRYRSALRLYQSARESKQWAGYPEHLQLLELPSWIVKSSSDDVVVDDPF